MPSIADPSILRFLASRGFVRDADNEAAQNNNRYQYNYEKYVKRHTDLAGRTFKLYLELNFGYAANKEKPFPKNISISVAAGQRTRVTIRGRYKWPPLFDQAVETSVLLAKLNEPLSNETRSKPRCLEFLNQH